MLRTTYLHSTTASNAFNYVAQTKMAATSLFPPFGNGYLGQDSKQQPGVGDHLTDPTQISGDHWHDVWDEVRNSGEGGDEGGDRRRP